MKRTLTLVALSLPLLFVACKKDDEAEPEARCYLCELDGGYWRMDSLYNGTNSPSAVSGGIVYWDLEDEGTFTMNKTASNNFPVATTTSGTYSVSDAGVISVLTPSIATLTIISLDDNRMLLKYTMAASSAKSQIAGPSNDWYYVFKRAFGARVTN